MLVASVVLAIGVLLNLSQSGNCNSPYLKQAEAARARTADIDLFDEIACNASTQPRVITDFSGWFSSPNFPATYPNDANCQWLIVSQSEVVRLDFEFFSTELSFDTVRIYDGNNSIPSAAIAGFDGAWTPLPTGIRSSGNSVLVVFETDGDGVQTGFNLTFTSELIDLTPDPCYSLTRPLPLTDPSGTFQSKGFPSNYWNYADCRWLFTSEDPNGVVEVTFDRFSTEGTYDYVYVYDGNSASAPVLQALHGDYPSGSIPPIRSTQQNLFIRLLADNNVVRSGFNGSYVVISGESTVTTGAPEITTDAPDITTNAPEMTTATEGTTTTSWLPAGTCGSILQQSPSEAAIFPGYDLMCQLNYNDTAHLDTTCYDLIQRIPIYGNADGLINQGGNFGCLYQTSNEYSGSENACYDYYQHNAKLGNCNFCTRLLVCIRFP